MFMSLVLKLRTKSHKKGYARMLSSIAQGNSGFLLEKEGGIGTSRSLSFSCSHERTVFVLPSDKSTLSCFLEMDNAEKRFKVCRKQRKISWM